MVEQRMTNNSNNALGFFVKRNAIAKHQSTMISHTDKLIGKQLQLQHQPAVVPQTFPIQMKHQVVKNAEIKNQVLVSQNETTFTYY